MRDAEFSFFFPYFFFFFRRRLYSGCLICHFSLVLRQAQLECSKRLAEIQASLPGMDLMIMHLSCGSSPLHAKFRNMF